MARSDAGKKRVSYNLKVDTRGKTFKENALLKSFWSNHTMEDMIKLTQEQLDAEIALWMDEFEAVQRKRTKGWIWKETSFLYDPTPKVKKEKKVNTKFNSSFSQKKVL